MKWSTQTLVLSLRRKDSPPPGDGKHCHGCRGRNDEDAHEAQEDGQAEVCGDQDSQRSILGRPVLRLATVVICYPDPQMPTLQHNPQSNNIHLPL